MENTKRNQRCSTCKFPEREFVYENVRYKLAGKRFLPKEHYVDAAYVDSYKLTESYQKYQVNIVDPVAVDCSWQAKSKMGFDVASFIIDWDKNKLYAHKDILVNHGVLL